LGPGYGGGDVVKPRTTAIIAVCSLALTLLAILDPWHTQVQTPVGRLVQASQLSSLTKIDMVNAAGEPLSEAGAVNADTAREFISVIRLLRSSREAAQRADLGFIGGAANLVLHNAGDRVEIRFGAVTLDGRHQWLSLDTSGPAYLVEKHLIDELLHLQGQLLSRKVLPSRPPAHARIELRGPGSWFQIEKGMVTWPALEGLQAPGSDPYIAVLRDALAALSFDDKPGDSPSCPPGLPAVVVRVGAETFEIQECAPCSPGRIGLSLGSRSGCAQADLWQQIWTWLAKPQLLAASWVLPTRTATGPFQLVCGERTVSVDPGMVDTQRLRDWWRRVDWSGRSLSVGSPPRPLCSVRGEGYEVHFGQVDGKWLAHRAPQPSAKVVLLRGVASNIEDLLRAESSRFLSRELISEEALSATRISIRDGAKQTVLDRSELVGVWSSQEQGLSELTSSELASVLLSALANLRAVDYVSSSERVRAPAKSGRRLTIDFAAPSDDASRHYEVWVVGAAAQSADRPCWAQVDDKPAAWLTPKACQRLLTKIP
jgi:hypothetical protein